MKRGLQAVAVAVGAWLTLVTCADAATLAVVQEAENEIVFYEAEPGEENRVRAESVAGLITVRDMGAQVIAGNECLQVSAHEATCQRNAAFPIQPVAADLGNGADRAKAPSGISWLNLEGGPGDDDLEGGGGFDHINGGTGGDRMDGKGGSGDFVSYFDPDREDDVRVTLDDDASNDGGNQDDDGNDRVLNMESAAGGAGDDHLFGTDGENTLTGQNGADVIEGMGGEDTIFGGEGADVVRGGGGPDGLQPQAGADETFGGAGQDVLLLGADGRPDLYDGGGDPGDEINVGTGSFRVELDGKANDGLCDQSPCATSSEKDNVRDFATLSGGFGSDLLIGSSENEFFEPSQGADVVKAKGGDDEVSLNPGDGADDVLCGGGVDTVDGEQLEDELVDCEN